MATNTQEHVLATLQKHANHKLIRRIIKHIKSHDIEVRTFDQFDNHALANVRSYLAKRSASKSGVDVTKVANRNYSGWIYGNVLYYNARLTDIDIVETIVHEYVHWQRKKYGVFRYGTTNEIFIEESTAELVSSQVGRVLRTKALNMRAIDDAYIQKVITGVVSHYKLPLDIETATSITTRNLPNVMSLLRADGPTTKK